MHLQSSMMTSDGDTATLRKTFRREDGLQQQRKEKGLDAIRVDAEPAFSLSRRNSGLWLDVKV
jgi:hypothetical protein